MRALYEGICDLILSLVTVIVRKPEKKTQRALLFWFFWIIAIGAFLFLVEALAVTITNVVVVFLLLAVGGFIFAMFVPFSMVYVMTTIYGQKVEELIPTDDEHWPW